MATKTEKKRAKTRANRLTIDHIKMGPEPLWQPGESEKLSESERKVQWSKAAHWYNYFYKSKDYVPFVIQYAEEVCKFDKDQIKALKQCEDWKLIYKGKALCRLHYRGWVHTEQEHKYVLDHLLECVEYGKTVVAEKKEAKKNAPPVISPAERTRRKVMDTVFELWDTTIVEGWMDQNFEESIDVFAAFKEAGLKSNAIAPFKQVIDHEYELINDAINKTCDQAVEAYSHISLANKKKMVKQMETIYADLDKLKLSYKAERGPRIKKRKATDVQVKDLKYKVEDMDYKLTSINPIGIPGSSILLVFNTKNRTLYQYETTATAGFEVGGTTIKNFDGKLSKCAKLRKPEVILPLMLTKTQRQIEKVWKEQITTKVSSPNGRINKDCILLRIL